MSVEVPVHQSTPDGISGVRFTVVAGSGWLRALGSYPPVVDALWRNAIDYAQIIKEYGGGNEDHRSRDGNRDRVLSVVAHATREPAGLATRERGPTDSHL